MFFLLKCGVWLAIVYAAIVYGIGPLGRFGTEETRRQVAGDATRVGQSAVGGVMEGVIGGISSGEAASLCARHRSECVADAARLTALLESNARNESFRTPKTQPSERAQTKDSQGKTAAPMPVPDPRRHVRPLRLTSKS